MLGRKQYYYQYLKTFCDLWVTNKKVTWVSFEILRFYKRLWKSDTQLKKSIDFVFNSNIYFATEIEPSSEHS